MIINICEKEITIDDKLYEKFQLYMNESIDEKLILVYIESYYDIHDAKESLNKLKSLSSKELSNIVSNGMKSELSVF